jgi:putative pyruvate formate lyase activating enzyme
MMLALQRAGCHNINFVTPTHVVAQILEALQLAAAEGLSVPLVYNSSGYERLETLKLLDGIVDIYMPDFKFWKPETAHRLCNALDYPECARNAIREMHRQVGDLAVGSEGIAYRGLLIRHLVLPEGLGDTGEIMAFISGKVSPDSYVNIMPQYRPWGLASEFPPLDRRPTRDDYQLAIAAAEAAGITRLDSPGRRWGG